MIKKKLIITFTLTITALINTAIPVTSSARDTTQTLKSLELITSGSSDIPDILKAGKINLPPVEIAESESKKSIDTTSLIKSTPHEKLRISNAPQYVNLQKKFTETQKHIIALQVQLQDKQRELDQRDQKINSLSTLIGETVLNRKLSDLQNQNYKLKKQLLTLSTNQSDDMKKLIQINHQLTESKSQNAVLTKRLATIIESNDEYVESARKMKVSLKESQDLVKRLMTKNADLTNESKRKDEKLISAQKSLVENQNQYDLMDKNLHVAYGKMKTLEKQLTVQSGQRLAVLNTHQPKSQNEVRSYALGTLWGQEVSGVMNRMKSDGITLELAQIISGVSDSINGKLRLSEQQITEQLDAMNRKTIARNKLAESGDDFLRSFQRMPGTNRAEMGYYYRTLNMGEGKITSKDIIAISVKESLSNGKVIKDMSKTGKVLALPLKNFPPLFSSAIKNMYNKGKIIMAVPPELAYGVNGRPPEIPPNSTMVYEITVMDVRPFKDN
ncbi:FKBP-type peptidyl-prolyl cis-trans isomerase [Enterobacter kobei]|uniref:FKBP-type peptidyl-prolyl cis-trans isomerase n=1 Tax=Enterobacter kobei TaxID=208224 RepID=UPI0020052A23|nr:FKBP-type peptidyl-prolyl cis-trans isomerase [Enterobacter kobei]MCK6960778.1 FKBP-type peptidyl-prolyl cis-trans isomerase [Enterobacter kobei]